ALTPDRRLACGAGFRAVPYGGRDHATSLAIDADQYRPESWLRLQHRDSLVARERDRGIQLTGHTLDIIDSQVRVVAGWTRALDDDFLEPVHLDQAHLFPHGAR